MTVWRMHIAWWISKAKNTHSEYVTNIGFLQQQWLLEGASMLLYVHCLFVCCGNINFILRFLYTSPFSVTQTGLETRPTYSQIHAIAVS